MPPSRSVPARRHGVEPKPPPPHVWAKKSKPAQLWSWLWSQPLANAWLDSDGSAVARYVELMTTDGALSLGAGQSMSVPLRTSSQHLAEIRNLEDRLGLTPKSLAQLGIQFVDDEVTDESDEVSQRRKRRRERLSASASAGTA